MIKSIRLKLTVYNTIIVILIIMCMSVFVYLIVNINSTINTDDELAQMAYELRRYVPIAENKSVSAELIEEYAAFSQKAKKKYISYGIWDYSDKTLTESVNMVSAPKEALATLRQAPFSINPAAEKILEESDGLYYIHIYRFEDYDLRICTVAFANDSGSLLIAQTYTDMNSKNEMVLRVRSALLTTAFVGILLSFLSGYFLSGKAIIPIEEAIKRQNEFFADASHELRTPITIIRTNLDVVKLSENEPVKTQMEWIDNAYDETKRMEKLVSDLLQVSKADLNMDSIELTPINLNELLLSEKEKFTPLANSKNVNLNLIVNDEDVIIDGSYNELDQLMVILIDNAFLYLGDGKNINITLTKEKDKAVIRVSDEGIGIAEEDLTNIFERFYRSDKARSRRAGGTGLGLSIAKRIVSLHNGSLTAKSVKNEGTDLIIELPLKEKV